MPVRSSVCTYSPSASVPNSKYLSTVLPSPSPLSIGHYKPLASSSTISSSPRSSYYGTSAATLSRLSSTNDSPSRSSISQHRYHSSAYNPSTPSYSTSSHTYSPALPSSSSPSGLYRPLASSTHNSFSTRYGKSSSSSSSSPGSSSSLGSNYTRYSSASSASSSSLSSATSLLDRNHDNSTSGYSSAYSNYQHTSTPSRLSTYTSTTTEPLPAEVPQGLINLGNTCYINATIQSLYSINSFRNFILRSPYDKILTSELSTLFKSMRDSSSPVNPSRFKQTFSQQQAKFSGLGQQDAQEFLRYLINCIHEEFNQATQRPRRSVPPKAPKTANEAWSQYRDIVDDSQLVDIVVGQMCSTIICSVCQSKSYCWDPFWDLSLPLIRGRSICKLSDVIQDFIAKETLDSDERPICSNCKKATRSTKQIELSRLPQLLILHLKKFTNDGYKMTSPEVKIDKTLTFNRGNTSYNLTACISHHGHSSSSGHYTSHCKYSSRWFHFNDDRIRDVTNLFDSSKLNDAYLLFYTTTSSSSSSSPSSSITSSLNQTKL